MANNVRTRPKNRRDSILAVASARFHRHGYVGTSLEDIAGDLGITAPALYRHFRGKDALYTAVLDAHLTHVERCVDEAASAAEAIAGLARVAVERPTLGMVWNTDRRRRLVDPDHAIQRRLVATADKLGALLGDGEAGELERLSARAVLAATSSTGFYSSPLGPEGQAAELERALTAVATFRNTEELLDLEVAGEGIDSRPWATRRTVLLDAASFLIVERGGFHAVTIEDIATAAGLGPNVLYLHFEGKADLLAAVLDRAATWLVGALERESSSSATAEEALARVITSSLEIGARHPSWTSTLADELANLPDPWFADLTARVEAYLEEWVALAAANAPGLSIEAAQVRIRAALAVLDDRAHEAKERRVLAPDDMVRLIRAMLIS
ncbi:TetR/AcrR family transcriptional regulator [Nocardioides sp. NPDC059952]|uniref:TetR/AcrR family transcriptional regulator n=1 Tax=Nocardioides sp. NPDC059952 TaxID=3347014 RepID=UPI0036547225